MLKAELIPADGNQDGFWGFPVERLGQKKAGGGRQVMGKRRGLEFGLESLEMDVLGDAASVSVDKACSFAGRHLFRHFRGQLEHEDQLGVFIGGRETFFKGGWDGLVQPTGQAGEDMPGGTVVLAIRVAVTDN